MPDCNDELFVFPSFDRRKIEASYQGGAVSSDGGVMLLREGQAGGCFVRFKNLQAPLMKHGAEDFAVFRGRVDDENRGGHRLFGEGVSGGAGD